MGQAREIRRGGWTRRDPGLRNGWAGQSMPWTVSCCIESRMARVLLLDLDCEENQMLSVRHPDHSGSSTDVDRLLSPSRLAARFRQVRALTESLSAPLRVEDYVIQSMPKASP